MPRALCFGRPSPNPGRWSHLPPNYSREVTKVGRGFGLFGGGPFTLIFLIILLFGLIGGFVDG